MASPGTHRECLLVLGVGGTVYVVGAEHPQIVSHKAHLSSRKVAQDLPAAMPHHSTG